MRIYSQRALTGYSYFNRAGNWGRSCINQARKWNAKLKSASVRASGFIYASSDWTLPASIMVNDRQTQGTPAASLKRCHAVACNMLSSPNENEWMKWKFNKIKESTKQGRRKRERWEGEAAPSRRRLLKWRCMPAGRMSNMRKYAHKIKQLVAISLPAFVSLSLSHSLSLFYSRSALPLLGGVLPSCV